MALWGRFHAKKHQAVLLQGDRENSRGILPSPQGPLQSSSQDWQKTALVRVSSPSSHPPPLSKVLSSPSLPPISESSSALLALSWLQELPPCLGQTLCTFPPLKATGPQPLVCGMGYHRKKSRSPEKKNGAPLGPKTVYALETPSVQGEGAWVMVHKGNWGSSEIYFLGLLVYYHALILILKTILFTGDFT